MPSLTRHATPRAWFIPVKVRTVEKGIPAPRRRRVWVVLVLLAGYLLFCHGCHGDEDNELFAPWAAVVTYPPTSAAATRLSSSLSNSPASGAPSQCFWTTPLWSITTTTGMARTP
jgi:hypothetical protein